MSNSPLVSYTKLSPNHSGKRKHTIDTISIHCMAGNLSVERCGELFQSKERQASSNYGIGSDGRIGLYVDEANRSWCTSSASNDNRAITIEVANTVAKDPWPVSDAAYKSLVDLLVDICQRNGIPKLLWKGDQNLVGQVDRQNMTVHRWFAAKACPGDWLYSRHGQIAAEVNKRLEAAKDGKEETSMDQATFDKLMDNWLQRQGAAAPSEWSREARAWAEENGIINGNDKGQKMYRSFCTREQLAVILYRIAKQLNRK
jgi:hypothetical protein|nr:MAG TPA: N-acetylmuramoyl-L-alanine amidase [Caudoviricetes sp.]